MTAATTTPNPSVAPAAPAAAQPAKAVKSTRPATAPKAPKASNAIKPTKKAVAEKAPTSKPAAATKPAKAAAAVKTGKATETKGKKPKLVRDSFTIPKDEYAVLDTLKDRATALAHPVKKSELLRAGLKVLAGLSDSALRSALQAVPSIKTGRPKADTAEAAPTVPAKATTKASGKAGRK
ncbi:MULTISPECIES: hypothetical protein [unclassified Acidovorax]|uniref:hypothetical protein n=1 Tax=unclassified Acidovorax TaxID=2684926 RepID=UPI000C191BC1|nr:MULTISPECIES: hypothetical protein [unclassified Acidovorax]PIF17363.1 hypothetical protein CLU87_1287 [Acidovorax sp. 59]PKW03613.1 hypothetical protein CLU89_3276 [Acidovorax sp. 30]